MSQIIIAIRAAQLTCEARSIIFNGTWVVVSSVCEIDCCCARTSLCRTINADVLQPDCESFVAELSESTKNRDLWTMSAAGVTLCDVFGCK